MVCTWCRKDSTDDRTAQGWVLPNGGHHTVQYGQQSIKYCRAPQSILMVC